MEGLLAMGLLSLDASSGFTTLRDATNALRSAALNPDAPLAPRPRFDTDAGSESIPRSFSRILAPFHTLPERTVPSS
eukprot:1279082-Rhodomonas_salina.1